MNTFEWLSRLIACDTTSRNSNLELINLVQDWFKRHQLESHLIFDKTEKKANLLATLPAENGDINGGIILSGHTDVVPVDGQAWETNPFEAVLKNGKVYGRGACDMKGFIAVALALLPEFQKLKLNQPIHFALSYDEEVGCLGAPFLIEDMQKRGIQPKACIVGEPTDMHAVLAHKGIQSFRCKVQGVAAHSSLTHQGCNAIEHAAKLINFLRGFADQLKSEGPFDEYFDVPYTTMSTNTIRGGIANNIIPENCEFTFEFRHLPKISAKEIQKKIMTYIKNEFLPEIKAEKEVADLLIENTAGVPAFEASSKDFIARAKKILQETEIRKVAYATEAGLFEQAQIPTIVCGPGNIREAHRANEFVTVEQLQQCEKFLRAIVSENFM